MHGFNRKRLTDARIIRSMSMEQLATALGVTKQMISKYEDGKNIPPLEAINKMAEILSVPKKYLFKESITLDTGSSTLFLRAPLATPKKTRECARIFSVWCYEISQAIANSNHPLSSFSIDSQLTIPEKAMELRRQWGLGTQPIKNMVTLLESYGFNIFSIDSPELKTEAYSQIINGTPIIVVNKRIGTAVRQRFSLAHELGHIVLHRNLVDWEFDLRNKEIENEAQLFAEYFLMPTGGFEFSFVSPKIERLIPLKKEWLVSLGSMIMHCEHIGLIDSEKLSSLQKQINARGWQKNEPLDNEIEYENPFEMRNRIFNKVSDREAFIEFFDELQLPMDNVENLCSLPSGTIMKFYDSSLENHDFMGTNQIKPDIEQLTLFDVGGGYYA